MNTPIYVYAGLLLGAGTLLVTGAPSVPVRVSPPNNGINVSTSPTLKVSVSDPNNSSLTVRFYGRLARSPGPDFTIAALPDTQYYTSTMNGGSPAIFAAQTDWIAANRAASNIAYVAHLGDIVNYGDNNRGVDELTAWRNATNALYRLENPVTTGLSNGIPYGAAVGNHDQSPNGDPAGTTHYYNQFFGASHFAGRSYYGGHYGTNNDNHFDLFSASGLDFIAVYLEYDVDANPLVLDWANNLLRTYSNRLGMVVSHYIGRSTTPSTLGAQGAATYSALRTNANLCLMLCGHVDGEGSRADIFNGNSVATLVSDYQYSPNGGSGLMRLMQFSPSNSVIRVSTYSPWLNQSITDEDSQFTIPFAMRPGMPEPGTNFTALGTNFNVTSGSSTSLMWPGLVPNRTYEWYVTVTDAANQTVTGSLWRFTTRPATAPQGVSSGLLEVSQIPGFNGEDENTNCLVALPISLNGFQIGGFNRADYNVQSGWTASDDPALGVLITSVAQTGRNNYGSNVVSTCGLATNASGAYRIVSYGCPNGAGGDGFEYNVNVAGAWFPYADWLGGFVCNDAGANGGAWNSFIGSPGLALGTHLVSLGGGMGVVNLTSLGIDSRTDGVLLVNHAKDEGNYALAQVNSANGTWNVFVHDNSVDGGSYEQDPLAFVFIPRTNTAVISGRFLGNGAISMFSGAAAQFTVTNLATGQWELKIPGYSPATGVLITSPEGGLAGNQDNIVTYAANSSGDGWIIESRDLPACALETPGGGSEPVASFIFIAARLPEILAHPQHQLATLGSNAVFSVAATGELPLYYQWRFNGQSIAGATDTSYIRTNVQPADLGGYSVVVSNPFASVTSSNAVLYINDTLLITGQPESQVVPLGQDATFSVGVSATPPLSYQWHFNGSPLPGATASSCVLTAARSVNVGSYCVVVRNGLGSVVSSNATLGVIQEAVWGDNSFGQGSSSGVGANLIAIAAGTLHNLGLSADGSVIAWGDNPNGQCDVPAGLGDALAVAAGGYHSLAVRANGTVVAWGAGDYGQTNVPAGLANVLGIAAGTWHSVALRADGTVVAWGDNSFYQTNVPAGLSNVVAVAAGGGHTLALKADGTVVAWGQNTDAEGMPAGQSVVPPGLANVVAIGAGEYHSLAVKADGTVVAWGDNSQEQCNLASGLTNIVAVAGGGAHSVALAADGSVIAWGADWNGQCDPPPGLVPVSGIAAGESHTAVLLADGIPVPQLLNPARKSSRFSALIQTLSRKHYALEFSDSLAASNWTALSTNAGNGGLRMLADPAATASQRFYRMRQW